MKRVNKELPLVKNGNNSIKSDTVYGRKTSRNEKISYYFNSKPFINIVLVPILTLFSAPIVLFPLFFLGEIPYIISSLSLFIYGMYQNYKFETADLLEYEKLIVLSDRKILLLEPDKREQAYRTKKSLKVKEIEDLKRLKNRTKFIFKDDSLKINIPIDKVQDKIYKI